jgi:DNA-binding response OmpR family regulator
VITFKKGINMYSVLVVDDDTDLLEMVNMALAANGFNIACISNGRSFFDAVSSTKPNVILLDVFLGDSDGRNLCHQLKTSVHSQNIPVILYSAEKISEDSLKQSMADQFIAKPFDIKQLVQKINSLVTERPKDANATDLEQDPRS